MINERQHMKGEPRYILQKLPDNLRDIDGSDLTDILKQFCRTFFLHNTRDKPKKGRGRPYEPLMTERTREEDIPHTNLPNI